MIAPKIWKRAGLISALLIVIIFCAIRASKDTDFDVYLLASQALLSFENIYNSALTDNVQYFYSPFFALALVPLSIIPFYIGKLLWLLLSTFFWYRINQIVIYELKKRNVLTVSYWPIVISNLILAGFIIDNYHMIQVTFLFLWGTLESIRLIFSKKQVRGSLLLGILINIKLLPLPFIPYLIYRKKFKAAFISICTFIALLILPSLFLGWNYSSFLHQQWWDTINPSSGEHVLETDKLVFNIQALVTNLFTDNSGTPFVSTSIIGNVILISILTLAAVTLVFLRTPLFADPKNRLHQMWEISFLLLVTIIIFPHQNKYATIYIFPAILYIVSYLSHQIRSGEIRSNFPSQVILATVILSFFLISLTGKDIIGNELYLVFSEIKSITIGELLLIPVLAYLTPERVLSSRPQLRPV